VSLFGFLLTLFSPSHELQYLKDNWFESTENPSERAEKLARRTIKRMWSEAAKGFGFDPFFWRQTPKNSRRASFSGFYFAPSEA